MGHYRADMTPETGRQPSDTQVFSGTGESPDHGRKALPRFDSPKRDDPQVLTIAQTTAELVDEGEAEPDQTCQAPITAD